MVLLYLCRQSIIQTLLIIVKLTARTIITAVVPLLFSILCGQAGAQQNIQRTTCNNCNSTDYCRDSYFIKTYYNNKGLITYGSDVALLNDNSSIVCGYTSNPAIEEFGDLFLYKVNANGQKLWEKNFVSKGTQAFQKITTLHDGNLASAGIDHLMQDFTFFVTKLDTAGNLLWKKSYQFTLGVLFQITSIKEDQEGAIYLTCYYVENGLSFNDRILLIKLNANGNILYSKSFKPPGDINVFFSYDLLIDGDYTYIAGNYHSYYHIDGALLKIRSSDGSLMWAKNYDFNNDGANFFQIFKYNHEQLCIIGGDSYNSTDTSIIFVCDTAGKVLSSKYFQQADLRKEGKAVVDNGGNVIWANFYYRFSDPGKTSFTIAKINPYTGVTWSKNYPQLQGFPYTNQIHFGIDSSIFVNGNNFREEDHLQFYLGKLSSNGDLGCAPELLRPGFGNGKSVAQNLALMVKDLTFEAATKEWRTGENQIDKTDSLCTLKNVCTTFKLMGPNLFCHPSDTLQLHIIKDATCFSTPFLSYDPHQLKLVEQTNVLAKFLPLKDGTAQISANLSNACSSLQDNITIIINRPPATLSLGADTVLCPGNTIVLNAHKGYTSYLWQDGNKDSTFTVTKSGRYWVTTTDACGSIFKDTIVVKAAPPIAFDLGGDLTKCNNDSLTLTAPAGFISYSWSPDDHISTTTGQSVTVNPITETLYKVRAEKTKGCFAYDSIRVYVHHSPPVDLGAAKSFCEGDSVVLDAGKDFYSYLWNTGATTESITIKVKGLYSIKAGTEEGCYSYDTLEIVNVFKNPVVAFNKDTALCKGDSKVLDAGNGYQSFLWNNGSTGSTITITDIGRYQVKVVDYNGCSGSDSTTITKLFPLPAHFLPADTSVCSYGALLIQPASSFSSYLWSTGAITKSITIKNPGIYTLQVKDDNHCLGSDTITIALKQCMEGFYIPNAFTPNGDGKNDQFKPLLFGNILSYHFTIYNRWGEKVFESTEVGKGWDGRVKAVDSDSHMYVWTCQYQLVDKPMKTEKGTVMLIR